MCVNHLRLNQCLVKMDIVEHHHRIEMYRLIPMLPICGVWYVSIIVE